MAPLRMSEAQLLSAVVKRAQEHGWLVNHQRPAPVRPGRWLTATQGDVGFPDLVMVRHFVLFVELKSDAGRMGPGQVEWGEALGESSRVWGSTVRYAVWRPRDWRSGLIEGWLA